MKSYAIGVDIGGTKVAIGIIDNVGHVLERSVLPTNFKIEPAQMLEQIAQEIQMLMDRSNLKQEQFKGIGVGAPGPLNTREGLILCPPNIPQWRNVQVLDQLRKYFDIPIVLENDANAAGLGEKWIGAAQGNNHFIYLTISTGIGAGIYLNGKLVSGSRGNAGDIGHMVINPALGTCTCGQKGCLEWIASGTAIARRCSELNGTSVSTKQAFELYEKKDKTIVPVIEDAFTSIGIACATLINVFDPEKIIIGGGVSEVGDPLFSAVQQYVSRYALNPEGRKTKIVPAVLRKDAGMIGAAALIHLPCTH